MNKEGLGKIRKSGDTLVSSTIRLSGRGVSKRFLSVSENTSSWFGGVADTLTSFGVVKFFFMALFLLTFVRLVFNSESQPLSFTMLMEMLSEIPQIDMNWVNNLWGQMNNGILYSNTPSELIGAVILIVNVLLWLPKVLLTLITGFLNIVIVIGTIVGWLTASGVSFG